MRLLLATLVVPAALIATQAQAKEDTQHWETLNVTVNLPDNFKLNSESIFRSGEARGFYEIEQNVMVGKKVDKKVTVCCSCLWGSCAHPYWAATLSALVAPSYAEWQRIPTPRPGILCALACLARVPGCPLPSTLWSLGRWGDGRWWVGSWRALYRAPNHGGPPSGCA